MSERLEKDQFSEAGVIVMERIIDHMGYDLYDSGWKRYQDGWCQTELLYLSGDEHCGEPLGVRVWAREEAGFVNVILCNEKNEDVDYAKAKVPTLETLDATLILGWSPVEYVEEETHLPWFAAHLVKGTVTLPPWAEEIIKPILQRISHERND